MTSNWLFSPTPFLSSFSRRLSTILLLSSLPSCQVEGQNLSLSLSHSLPLSRCMFFFSSLAEAREETETRESMEPRTSLLAG